jgi:hypothetical protein
MKSRIAAAAPTHAPTALHALLRHLIDYAGLFPPAALGMLPSVTDYAAYLRSDFAWILGRFIVPGSRLQELEDALRRIPEPDSVRTCWELSVLLGPDAAADAARIVDFNMRGQSDRGFHLPIESVEVKVESPEEVKRLAAMIPRGFTTYFEIPLAGRKRECIAAVAECGRRAKIRTGGETADKFPDPARVLEFIKLCADARVPFKATAGLHHPLRSVHPLTYKPDSPSGWMHGFLNVFLAAAFLRAGMEPRFAAELLEERSAEAICWTSDEVRWRNHHLAQTEIATARQHFCISFGSCSFMEPIDDLRSLGLL